MKPAGEGRLKKNIPKNSGFYLFWRWIKFLVWLPWFFLTWPWQLRKAYGQVMSSITLQSNPKGGDDSEGICFPPGHLHSVPRERLRARLN